MTKNKPTPNPNLYPIIAGVDFDEAGANALRAAVGMARMSLMELHICHAVSRRPELDASERHMLLRLNELVEFSRPHIPAELNERVHLHLTFDSPVDALVQLAVDVDAQLIVVGTHDKNVVERLVSGSVSAKLLQHAPCPVLIAIPPATEPRSKVPVIYDSVGQSEPTPYRVSTRGVMLKESA